MIVNWNIEVDLMALLIALPEIQLLDLVREPLVRQVREPILQHAGLLSDPISFRIQLGYLALVRTGVKAQIPQGKRMRSSTLASSLFFGVISPFRFCMYMFGPCRFAFH